MDNAIAATHHHPHMQETAVAAEHVHISLPQHRHHFETEAQQLEAGSFGMWIFLLGEIMFFGGMFFAYLLYRNWYYPSFVAGSNTLSLWAGSINTVLLATSSLFMAIAVFAAEARAKTLLVGMLALATLFGLVFVAVEINDYHDVYTAHHIPGAGYDISQFVTPPKNAQGRPIDVPLPPGIAQRTQVFFFLFFAMTGMHLTHMTIGLCLLFWLLFRANRGEFSAGYTAPITNFALYWHFVDIVWIFLFPLFYLVNLHPFK